MRRLRGVCRVLQEYAVFRRSMPRLRGLCCEPAKYAAIKWFMPRTDYRATLYESALGIRGEDYT